MKNKIFYVIFTISYAFCLLVIPSVSEANEEGQQIYRLQEDVRIPTSMGFTLSANIFSPLEDGNYPVIMSMGPYDKNTKNEEADIFGVGQIAASDGTGFEQPDPEFWVSAGYVVIYVDSPGSGLSDGVLDILSQYEAKTYYDAIEWAGVQEWSNGNVGLNGVSYYAMSQWQVASLNPPHLKAIAPEEGTIDFYRDIYTQGGIPSPSFLKKWATYRIKAVKNPNSEIRENSLVNYEMAPELFNDWWQAYVPDLSKITVPAYIVASWTDQGMHTRGTLLGFEGISSEQKWLEVHGRKKWEYYYQREHLERVRRFFDYFLKGEDNGFEATPQVCYEARNAFYDGEIRFANEWPLPNTELKKLYLNVNGTLNDNSQNESHSLSYQSDDGSQLAFTYTFEEDTEITGAMKLKLWVASEIADDMDLFVGVSKLNNKGKEIFFSGYDESENAHVASGWLRVSRRAVDKEQSKENQPFLPLTHEEKLSPNEIVPVEIEILASSTLFKKGESLVLRIQGIELDGAGGLEAFGRENKVNIGQHIIYMGAEYDSYLLIPEIEL